MTEQQLRELVRESIARQLGSGPAAGDQPSRPAGPGPVMADARLQASHAVYLLPRDDEDGPCVIEPSVPCTHCNYCKSHGH